MNSVVGGGGGGGVVSKTSALRSLLVRAWRERWSDIQWSIHLKEVLPRGATGDVYNLSSLILQQALLSPVPNPLLLGYLNHALSAQTVSHTAVLEAVTSFDFSSGGSLNKRRRPYCTQSLLELISRLITSECLTSHGKPEECVALSTAVLKVALWLLRIIQNVLSLGVDHFNDRNGNGDVDAQNCKHAVRLLQSITENEFTLCLLYIGKLEEKETYVRMLSTCKRLSEQVKTIGNISAFSSEENKDSLAPSSNQTSQLNNTQNFKLKQEVARMVSALTSNGLDPMACVLSGNGTMGCEIGSVSSTNTNGGTLSNGSKQSTFVHGIQPILIFEALHRTTSNSNDLAHHLYALAFMHQITFSDLVYEILRSLLLSISQQDGLETLKIDSFILIKLPSLLEKLYLLIKAGIDISSDTSSSSASPGSIEPGTQTERSANLVLKTPTDVYKAFDKILKNGGLLDSVDYRCKCNIIELLLVVVGKSTHPLLTDTERDDVMKRRVQARSSETRISNPELLGIEVVGPSRDFECSLKAASILDGLMSSISVDLSKAECMEKNLDTLCNIINSSDLLLAASAAQGKLDKCISCLIRLNQQSQESQGESVKNSLLRAALFDITFLMLVYIAQCFGSGVVLKDAKGTFIHSWITEMMVESDGHVKPFEKSQFMESSVDTLLQQLNNGELRTQVVKWQNICSSVHMAMKDIAVAKYQNVITEEKYNKMCSTLCSRLYALPVCVIAWFASYRLTASQAGPKTVLNAPNKTKPEDGKPQQQKYPSSEYDVIQQNLSEIALNFANNAENITVNNATASNGSSAAPAGGNPLVSSTQEDKPMPHHTERLSLMVAIMNKMLIQSGIKTFEDIKPHQSLVDPPVAVNKLLQQWELTTVAYALKGSSNGMDAGKGKVDSLTIILLDVWRNQISRMGRLDIESAWKIRHLLAVGGSNWMTSVLVDELFNTVYHHELEKMTELLVAVFHVDIEQCTLSLLLHVAPTFLQYQHKRDRLTDPHGTAFAKVIVSCIYSVLNVAANSGAPRTQGNQNAVETNNLKRGANEDFSELPSAKMRRLLGYQQNERSGQIGNGSVGNGGNLNSVTFASTFDEYLSSGSITSSNSPLKGSTDSSNKEGQIDTDRQVLQHPVSRATASFFQLLYTTLCYGRASPSPINCPITHFAFRFLEQIAFRGGPGPGFFTSNGKNSCSAVSGAGSVGSNNADRQGYIGRDTLAGCRSRLLFQHFDIELILHLVKVVPEMFVSLGIITRLFDISR